MQPRGSTHKPSGKLNYTPSGNWTTRLGKCYGPHTFTHSSHKHIKLPYAKSDHLSVKFRNIYSNGQLTASLHGLFHTTYYLIFYISWLEMPGIQLGMFCMNISPKLKTMAPPTKSQLQSLAHTPPLKDLWKQVSGTSLSKILETCCQPGVDNMLLQVWLYIKLLHMYAIHY